MGRVLKRTSMSSRPPVVEFPDRELIESLRRLTPAERLRQAFAMWDFAMTVMRASIRRDHSDWTDEQVQREIFQRIRGVPAP